MVNIYGGVYYAGKNVVYSTRSTSLTNIYGTNYLIIIGEAKLLRKITMMVSLLSFSIAFPFIYYYSYIGAACTMALARIILGLSVYYIAKKRIKL